MTDPVKGLRFIHSKRTRSEWNEEKQELVEGLPVEFEITHVDKRRGIVFAKPVRRLDYFFDRIKIPLHKFDVFVSEVTLTPEKTKSSSPKFTDAEAFELWNVALTAGRDAAAAAKPTPIVVERHANPLDDNSPVEQSYYVPEGLCGFAWVNVKPGNSSFARWLKKTGRGRTDSYAGGVQIWIHGYNQSYELKRAHAGAFAQVLRDAGVNAYGSSRLD